jgi:subtilisin family serine protease
MSEKEYIVTLKKGVDYEAFNAEMIATTGSGAIPNRSATVANPRPGSQRNTHYMLTAEEAADLSKDGRVVAVELRPDLRDDIELIRLAEQTGDFSKTTDTRGEYINWGLRRVNEINNPYIGYSVSGNYNYTLDGTGVDIVIQDSGIQANHPDFQDANGSSRVQQIDWFTESGLPGSMPTDHYTDFDGHGTHCAGIAAGKTYGWAKNARIYAVKVAGLEGTTDPNNGIAISDVFDIIKEWHNNKPIDLATGAKRPTIVNMSWGYGTYFYDVAGGEYRETPWVSPDTSGIYRDTAKGMIGSFRSVSLGYRFGVRVASVDADVEELIDAGVHVCVAAGNSYQKIDVLDGEDYDNFFTRTAGSAFGDGGTDIYYNRGGSPFSTEAFIVGNIDKDLAGNGREQKAESSEAGPGVNIFAPGTGIFSTLSETNEYSDGPYPPNAAFNIGSLSGTSMAAPQVAGVLSLWLQLNPGATPAQALSYFTDKSKTDRIYTTGLDNDYTDSRSLLGGNNRFLWNKFNSKTQLSIGSTLTEAQEETTVIPTYALASSDAATNEGTTITITLTTTNIPNGSEVDYVITGVEAGDFGGSLTGTFTILNNSSTQEFTFVEDLATEGAETFTLSLVGIDESVSVTINDTSTGA